MDNKDLEVTQADREANNAEAFGRAFRAEQAANYGCAGEIECTFKFDGNCVCFNNSLAQSRSEVWREAVEAAAKVADARADALETCEGELLKAQEREARLIAHTIRTLSPPEDSK